MLCLSPIFVLITGKNKEEHLRNLDMVLKRLSQYGLRANLEKCEFFKRSITLCRHVIDKNSLHKAPEKTDVMINAISSCNAAGTIAPAEKNYYQIDKVTLIIIWGIKKFHSYSFGREFKLIIDHQPLIHIFSP